jgi:hypothetical protein
MELGKHPAEPVARYFTFAGDKWASCVPSEIRQAAPRGRVTPALFAIATYDGESPAATRASGEAEY